MTSIAAGQPGFPRTLSFVDSHTEGEPTRVIVNGWPQLEGATMADRRLDFQRRFDQLRSAVVCEPRGHDAVVGALLTDPVAAGSEAGVIFFNNASVLGMCGHGLMGVVRTLQHIGRIQPGVVQIDTPVGMVSATLHESGEVTIRNVPSFTHALDVAVAVPGLGMITGDVAYGGNWFFITHLPDQPLTVARLGALTDVTRRIQTALADAGITGADGAEIDHIELFEDMAGGARNFVMCPGGAYDRSPCGTGTSAKLAVLHARGLLDVGEGWRQESVTGGVFAASLEQVGSDLVPVISGRAFITSSGTLHFDESDPLVAGFTSAL